VPAVRQIATRYDVIDANQGDLPVGKNNLRFDGLLVNRSNGLIPMYREFQDWAHEHWPDIRGRAMTRQIYRARRFAEARRVRRTYQEADVIVTLNEDERDYLEHHFGLGFKVRVIPLGLTRETLDALAPVACAASDRQRTQVVVFIGTWDFRKGARDWRSIAHGVLSAMPSTTFTFLGTHVDLHEIGRCLGDELTRRIRVIPSYERPELPRLLSGATVGALPSYIEGSPLGVLEQLAAGIPTVAYDVPGPRQLLSTFGSAALVPRGDTDRFVNRLVAVLQAKPERYQELAAVSRARAEELQWGLTVDRTLRVYEDGLTARAGTGQETARLAR
jgi:glycosyltransferase involved in cell wall biosynthesis